MIARYLSIFALLIASGSMAHAKTNRANVKSEKATQLFASKFTEICLADWSFENFPQKARANGWVPSKADLPAHSFVWTLSSDGMKTEHHAFKQGKLTLVAYQTKYIGITHKQKKSPLTLKGCDVYNFKAKRPLRSDVLDRSFGNPFPIGEHGKDVKGLEVRAWKHIIGNMEANIMWQFVTKDYLPPHKQLEVPLGAALRAVTVVND